MALPSKNRIKRQKKFDELFRNSWTLKGRFLLIKYSKELSRTPQIGFIVQSKIAKKATQRNFIKRLLIETVHKNLNKIRRNAIILVLRLPETEFIKKLLLIDLNKLISNLYT